MPTPFSTICDLWFCRNWHTSRSNRFFALFTCDTRHFKPVARSTARMSLTSVSLVCLSAIVAEAAERAVEAANRSCLSFSDSHLSFLTRSSLRLCNTHSEIAKLASWLPEAVLSNLFKVIHSLVGHFFHLLTLLSSPQPHQLLYTPLATAAAQTPLTCPSCSAPPQTPLILEGLMTLEPHKLGSFCAPTLATTQHIE